MGIYIYIHIHGGFYFACVMNLYGNIVFLSGTVFVGTCVLPPKKSYTQNCTV